jgi:hypothetical protein
MRDAILTTIGTLVVGMGIAALGIWLGYYLKDLKLSISALRSRVKSLEEDEIPYEAIIDAKTPKQVNEDRFDDDEESSIISAKKPGELAREKDRKLQEELDKLGR